MATKITSQSGPCPKTKTPRNPKYLEFVRSRACCVCGLKYTVVAHHIRMGGGGGTGIKPSDYRTVPLCDNHHKLLHQMGERSFWMIPDAPNPENVVLRCLKGYVTEMVGDDAEAIALVIERSRKR